MSGEIINVPQVRLSSQRSDETSDICTASITGMPSPRCSLLLAQTAQYNASKAGELRGHLSLTLTDALAAIKHLAASLAVEWAKTGIRVNCLAPGYMLTTLTRVILDNNPDLANTWTSLTPMGESALSSLWATSHVLRPTGRARRSQGRNCESLLWLLTRLTGIDLPRL